MSLEIFLIDYIFLTNSPANINKCNVIHYIP